MSFSDGIEFEETFPEAANEGATAPALTPPSPAPAPAQAAPRLTVVRDPEPTPEPATEPAPDIEALVQERIDQRLREAEATIAKSIEHLRAEEEQRLAELVRRREEEERRASRRAEESHTGVERRHGGDASSVLGRRGSDDVVSRVERAIAESQTRFEERLDQRLRELRSHLERTLDERFAKLPAPASTPTVARAALTDAILSAPSAREIGRIVRDAVASMARTSAFALAMHRYGRYEVAYRYRVASDDELGGALRRDGLDDGPDGAAAHADGWVQAQRTVRAGGRNEDVHTAQLAIRHGDATVAVLTLQTQGDAIAEAALVRIADLATVAAPRLAQLRARGSYQAE